MLLALAYATAYMVGVGMSGILLSRRLGAVFDAGLGAFLTRLSGAALASAAVMLGTRYVLHALGLEADRVADAAAILALAGLGGGGAYLITAKVVGVREVGSLLSVIRHR